MGGKMVILERRRKWVNVTDAAKARTCFDCANIGVKKSQCACKVLSWLWGCSFSCADLKWKVPFLWPKPLPGTRQIPSSSSSLIQKNMSGSRPSSCTHTNENQCDVPQWDWVRRGCVVHTLALSMAFCGIVMRGKVYMAPCTGLQVMPGTVLKISSVSLAFSAKFDKTTVRSWKGRQQLKVKGQMVTSQIGAVLPE